MPDENLVSYIDSQIKRGVAENDIRSALTGAGWNQGDIDNGFAQTRINASPSSEEIVIKKKRLNPLVFFVVGALMILASAAIYGYRYYYLSPERIMARVYENIQTINSFNYSGTANISIKKDLTEIDAGSYSSYLSYIPKNYYFNFDGQFVLSEEKGLQNKNKLRVSTDKFLTGEFDSILTRDIFFLNFVNLPDFGMFVDPEIYAGKWIKFDITSSQKSDSNLENGVDEETKSEYSDLFKTNPPIQFKEKLDDASVNGVDAYHYTFEISEENIIEIVRHIDEKSGDTDLDLNELKTNFGNLEFENIEVWIGKKDKRPVKVKFGLTVLENQKDPLFKFGIESYFKDYNLSPDIEIPEESQSIYEFMNDVWGEIQNGSGDVENTFDFNQLILPGNEKVDETPSTQSLLESLLNINSKSEGQVAGLKKEL